MLSGRDWWRFFRLISPGAVVTVPVRRVAIRMCRGGWHPVTAGIVLWGHREALDSTDSGVLKAWIMSQSDSRKSVYLKFLWVREVWDDGAIWECPVGIERYRRAKRSRHRSLVAWQVRDVATGEVYGDGLGFGYCNQAAKAEASAQATSWMLFENPDPMRLDRVSGVMGRLSCC